MEYMYIEWKSQYMPRRYNNPIRYLKEGFTELDQLGIFWRILDIYRGKLWGTTVTLQQLHLMSRNLSAGSSTID